MTAHRLRAAPPRRPGGPDCDRHRRRTRLRRQKADGQAALAEMGAELADLQERLWAERTAGSGVGSCWCCKAWTPPARAACCATRSAWSTPRACGSRASRRRPRRSAHDFLWRIRGPARRGLHRGLRPLALRGRPDRPGRGSPTPRRSSVATERSTTSRPGSSTRASRSSSACSTSAPTSRRRASPSGSPTRRSTGSTTPATSTSAPTGRPIARRTRSRSSARAPTSPRGTWCRRTRSGSATWPWARSCSTPCGASTCSGPPRTSTWGRDRPAGRGGAGPVTPRPPSPSRATSRPCVRAAACPGSWRPTTSAPTSASSAARARARRCWWPR